MLLCSYDSFPSLKVAHRITFPVILKSFENSSPRHSAPLASYLAHRLLCHKLALIFGSCHSSVELVAYLGHQDHWLVLTGLPLFVVLALFVVNLTSLRVDIISSIFGLPALRHIGTKAFQYTSAPLIYVILRIARP